MSNYICRNAYEFLSNLRALRRYPPIKISVRADLHSHMAQYARDEHYFTSPRYLKYGERAIWNGTDPLVRYFAGSLIREMRKRGIPMYVHTAWRSNALQARLKREGLSNLSDGPHQRGCAVDVVSADFQWVDDPKFWEYVGTAGKAIIKARSLPIEWGGDWSRPWDPAHWQLSMWRDFPPVDDLLQGEIETVMPVKLYKDNVSYAYEPQKTTNKRIKQRHRDYSRYQRHNANAVS
jgi:hypothetical protein